MAIATLATESSTPSPSPKYRGNLDTDRSKALTKNHTIAGFTA